MPEIETQNAVSQRNLPKLRIDIQWLRAVAVLAVVINHAFPNLLPGGFTGVDVFFVISGFLITSHLHNQLQATEKIRFSEFYARRMRRLLPAAFATIAATIISATLWAPKLILEPLTRDAIATLIYVPNVWFAQNSTAYFSQDYPSLLLHFWSLGVEEQFYLLWPVMLYAFFKIARKSKAKIMAFTILLVAASFALNLVLTQYDQSLSFFLLPTRAWQLGFGALVAFITLRFSASYSWFINLAVTIGISGILSSFFLFSGDMPYPGSYALIPTVATCLVILGFSFGYQELLAQNRWVRSVFAFHPAQFIGKISYSLYLVHWPLIILPKMNRGLHNEQNTGWTAFWVIISIAIAYVMWRYIETPFRRGTLPSARTSHKIVIVSYSLCISLLVAGIVTVFAPIAKQEDRLTSALESSIKNALTNPPTPNTFIPANLVQSLLSASTELPSYYGKACDGDFSVFADLAESDCMLKGNFGAPLVMLIGDSHAGHWFPALEDLFFTGRINLLVLTKNSCPFAGVHTSRDDESCMEWRARTLATIKELRPDYTIIGNRAIATCDESETQTACALRWGKGLNNSFSAITDFSEVHYILQLPDYSGSVPICLSIDAESTERCIIGSARAVYNTIVETERRVSEAAGVKVIDVNDHLCDRNTCYPIVSNHVVYRDGNHLSTAFSKSMSSWLEEKILQTRANDERGLVQGLVSTNFRGGTKATETGQRSADLKGTYDPPDIISELQAATSLTRKTIIEILLGSGRLQEFIDNPNDFIQIVKPSLEAVLAQIVTDGVQYEKIGGYVYELRELQKGGQEEKERFRDPMYNLEHPEKSDFDYVVHDSEPERQFAELLDGREDVKLFMKLPAKFKIDTPVGPYNPDWAIIKHENGQDRVYMVRETKSTDDPAKRRPTENAKIDAARAHFKAIGVDDYATATPGNWRL